MNKGPEITRGKTKVLYEHPGQPDMLVVAAVRQHHCRRRRAPQQIAGKGRIAAKTTSRVFRLLNLCGLPTHYLRGGEDDDDNEMLVRRCTMIPLEVVVRGVAAGSLVKRKPGIARGSIIVPRMVEFFFKDDANHDPLIEPDEIVARGLATPQEIGVMTRDRAAHVRDTRARLAPPRHAAGRSERSSSAGSPAARARGSSSSPT